MHRLAIRCLQGSITTIPRNINTRTGLYCVGKEAPTWRGMHTHYYVLAFCFRSDIAKLEYVPPHATGVF